MQLSPHEAAVARVAGLDLVKRAIGYARGGAVTQVRFDNTGDVISAQVRGTASRPYSTRVILTRNYRDAIEDYLGVCSCPVHDDCKHAVALLLVALAPSDLGHRGAPDWREALDALRRTSEHQPPQTDEPPPVALQFSITEYGVTVRPVARGRNDNWVRSGISWRNFESLRYSQSPRARASHRVLAELSSLGFDTFDYAYSRPAELSLAEVDSRRLWDVLADAARTGMPFVSAAAKNGPVTLHEGR